MSCIVCLPLLLHLSILVHNTVQSDTLASYHIKESVTVITLQRFHWSFVTEYLFMVFIRTIACVFNQKIKKLQKAASRRHLKNWTTASRVGFWCLTSKPNRWSCSSVTTASNTFGVWVICERQVLQFSLSMLSENWKCQNTFVH